MEANPVSEAATHKPPNILLVVADDQSWLHTSYAGDPIVKTRAFDRIAREGLYFEHAFTASPSCSPSRAAILAGQDIWRLRQAGLLHSSIPADMPVFTHALEDHGYHVGHTGKGWAPGDWQHLGLSRPPTGAAYDSIKENRYKQNNLLPKYISRLDYSANFDAFLDDKNADQPFFFWFGPREPHRHYARGVGAKEGLYDVDDVNVPPFLPDESTVKQDMLDYYYGIQWYDSHLLSMLESLERRGELENTLIVVTSDNGMPFPRAKTTLYDWGTRMPLAIRWGEGIVNPGREIEDFVVLTDLAPTFLELAGIPIPEGTTGQSLKPIFQASSTEAVPPTRDAAIFGIERHTYARPNGAGYPSRAIRTKEYLYIHNFEPDRWPAGAPDFLSSNKQVFGDIDPGPTRDYILSEPGRSQYPEVFEWATGKRPREELYKMDEDPGQINNLAHDPAYDEIKNDLSDRLMAYLRATNDPRMDGQDPWQDYIYHQYERYGMKYNALLPDSERARAELRPGYYDPY